MNPYLYLTEEKSRKLKAFSEMELFAKIINERPETIFYHVVAQKATCEAMLAPTAQEATAEPRKPPQNRPA